jgi:hypothetical protein
MFLGPGVYEDHEKYKSLTKAPCTAVYVIIVTPFKLLTEEKCLHKGIWRQGRILDDRKQHDNV